MRDGRLAQLVDHGSLGKALQILREESEQGTLSLSDQTLRLELTSVTAANNSCIRESIALLSNTGLSDNDRARCLTVAGVGYLREGASGQGTSHLQRARNLADGLGPEIAGHVSVNQLAALASWIGPQEASAEVAATRRLVIRAGRPQLATKFHIVLAEIAAKLSLLRRAQKHLDLAAGLLATFENRYLEAEHAIRSGALSALASDPSGAVGFARMAIDLALESGAPTLEVVARTNLAHAYLAQGEHALCHSELLQALACCRFGGSAELGIRDGLLQYALAADLPEMANRVAEETYQKSLGVESGLSYYGLWHLLTRVKWMYRTGEAKAGVALALEVIPHIEGMADRNLLERMKLLAADGLGRIGQPAEGASLMADAVIANPDPSLETMAEATRVAGRLAAHDDLATALTHFGRAGRILQSVGNVTARDEIMRDSVETAATAGHPPPRVGSGAKAELSAPSLEGDRERRPNATRPPAAAITERIAALVDFADHPPLLASETISLIADSDAALRSTIVEIYSDGRRQYRTTVPNAVAPATIDESVNAVRIKCGRRGDCDYEIVAIPRGSPAARATLLSVERLVQTAMTLSRARHGERELAALWPERTPEQQLGLVCASERMLDLISTARRIAPSNITVLITGESGVGKELFARALHRSSARHAQVFLPFNCAAIPREMLESQLFGYRRGAFTGAHEDFPGLIRSAAGGTLFLDEVGDMSPDVQPKLLRFLESGEILPLGDVRPHTVDVRVVAATNASLDQLVSEGRFREDLYYRLNVIQMRVPPLRERREEIPLLVDHFLEKFCREQEKPALRIDDATLEYLVLHAWPGNVRQLANEIRRMVAMADPGDLLTPEHLSSDIAAGRRTAPSAGRPHDQAEMVVRTDQSLAAATELVERAMIQRALAACEGRNEAAAQLLGLSRKGLYLKRRRLRLE